MSLIVANDSREAPSVGHLAVTPPKPPVIAPPLLDKALPQNTTLRIDLKTQRLYLLVGDEIAIDSPISSGRRNFTTPSGKFLIGKKELKQRQNDYGNFADANGKIIVSGAYQSRDPIPSGLRFQAVPLNHVMQIKDQRFTIHGGATSSLPISTGNIIVPEEIAKILFARVATGCPLEITEE